MPRISIVQSVGGDPFAMYHGMMNYVASVRDHPYFYEYYGPVTYGSGTVQVLSQGVVTGGNNSIYVEEHVVYAYGAGGEVTGFRIGSPWVPQDQPGTFTELIISGFSTTLEVASTNLEAHARLYAFDYSGSAGNDNLMGTDYDDVLNGNGGNDYLAGGVSNDIIYGGLGNDELRGGSGADSNFGGQGDDFIVGGQGWDTLRGGEGSDTLNGSVGQDSIDGGNGLDTVTYLTATAGVIVDLNNGAVNTGEALGDSITNVENIEGSGYADDLRGTVGTNRLVGGAGSDILYGRGGDDFLFGGASTDQLYGGAGADMFRYVLFSGVDRVRDFSYSDGDVLNIAIGNGIDTFAEVMTFARQVGNDTVFQFRPLDVLIVENTTVAGFSANDFFFV